jgi:molecular chaperone GrpE
VEKLLPVLDSFDAALAQLSAETDAGVRKGVELVFSQLVGVLEATGLERIESDGAPFDPNEHEAVLHEDGDGDPVVAATMRTGYRLKGRVLRPAMVKVTK